MLPETRHLCAPLVIGVTGHRDLRSEDLEKLKDKVRKILAELRERYRSTPFILLSPLAEGADTLVAQVALEIGAELVVPLPMLRRLYEKDFQTPESLETFRRLADQAYIFEMPMLSSEADVARGGEARDRQYQQTGRYIARQSQILIALWDCTLSEKTGGTAEVVGFQLQGAEESADCDLQPPELFPVYHVVTPRISNPHPEGDPFQLIKKFPAGFLDNDAAEAYYGQIFGNLDEFNNCILNGAKPLMEAAAESKRDLLCDFDGGDLTPNEQLALDRYAVADALARLFQRRLLNMHRALHWLVFVSFLGLVLFAHLPQHPIGLLAGALVVLGVGYLWQRHTSNNKLDIRAQDYRAIAEGSRVRFFWHMAGITESVADNYLGKQRTELDWIRNGLRGWGIGKDSQANAGPLSKKRLEAVEQLWIADQIGYFHDTAKSNEDKQEHMETLVRVSVWLVVLIALGIVGVTLLMQHFNKAPWKCNDYEWLAWPVIVFDCLLGAAALLHHASQQRAYAQHTKQFRRMETVFQKAQLLIQRKFPNINEAQQCLRTLGQEALFENGDWVLLHRERPLELPHP
jgi:hypothetical protein